MKTPKLASLLHSVTRELNEKTHRSSPLAIVCVDESRESHLLCSWLWSFDNSNLIINAIWNQSSTRPPTCRKYFGPNKHIQSDHRVVFAKRMRNKTICFNRSQGGDQVQTCDYLSLMNEPRIRSCRRSDRWPARERAREDECCLLTLEKCKIGISNYRVCPKDKSPRSPDLHRANECSLL